MTTAATSTSPRLHRRQGRCKTGEEGGGGGLINNFLLGQFQKRKRRRRRVQMRNDLLAHSVKNDRIRMPRSCLGVTAIKKIETHLFSVPGISEYFRVLYHRNQEY